MSHKTAIRIYEIASYVLILGATVLLFVVKPKPLALAMMLIAVAVFCRWMMDRHRYRACEEELDMAQADLRRLTLLLAEEKKKNNNNK